MSLKSVRYKSLFVSIGKWETFSFYVNSILIGVWVFLKWFLSYLFLHTRKYRTRSTKYKLKETPDQPANTNLSSPPSFLVDNFIGQHSYIKVKAVKFHYVVSGKAHDPTILLLHGFPDCWISWRHQIKELSRFFRVIALDLKGFNDSDKPIWRNHYKPKTICRELANLVRSFHCNSVSIIGHDLGALIGWMFAHTNPDLVNKFVCVSAPHPNLFWNRLSAPGINNSWLRFIQVPFIAEMEHTRADSKFLERCLPHLYRDEKKGNAKTDEDGDFHEQIVEAYRYVFSRKSDWSGPFNYYRNFPFYRIQQGVTIPCPCLIVTGNADTQHRLEAVISSTEYCDSFVVKIIEGAGHYPHQEKPEEFNKAILKFLVGQRANSNEDRNNNGTNGNEYLIGKVFGLVSNGVNRVHNKTNEMLHNILPVRR